MTTNSREEILSEFQNCTGLENIEDCIYILEQHQWNLQTAVQEILERLGTPQENESTVPLEQPMGAFSSVGPRPNNQRQSYPDQFHNFDESRTTPPRNVECTIIYTDKTVRFKMMDSETVDQLKMKIFEKFQISGDEQEFLDWKDKTFDDQTPLKNLLLSKENFCRLLLERKDFSTQTTTSASNSSTINFLSLIRYTDGSNQSQIKDNVPNPTIFEAEQIADDFLSIPVAQEDQSGLQNAPGSSSMSETNSFLRNQWLFDAGFSQLIADQPTNVSDPNNEVLMDVDTDPSRVPQTDDPLVQTGFTSIVPSDQDVLNGREPLIPEQFTDYAAALEHFSLIFHSRYGPNGPIIYIGSLEAAIQDSFYTSIEQRRPLAIYIHDDHSADAQVFCTEVLSAESIVEYVANNYIFWAWDITLPSNRQELIQILRRSSANHFLDQIGATGNETFPLLILVTRTRGVLDVVELIAGRSSPSEVISSLIQAHESFEEQRQHDAEEELLRRNREELKQQQEDEYRLSIAADLEKQRQRENDERKQREEQDANERLQQQRLRQQQECQARLPEEPNETESQITQLKIRLPDDERILMRRFRITDNLQMLFDYLTSQGKMLGEYKLLTTYPKRDLTTLDKSKTFEQLKLYPQEQLILESL